MNEKLVYINDVKNRLNKAYGDGNLLGLDGVLDVISAVDAVEIPCKIGDVVWTWLYDWRHEAGISPYQITNLTITQNKRGIWTKKYRAMRLIDGKIINMAMHFGFDEIGKKVFFSKEEAEKMLLRGDDDAVD